MLTLSPTLLEDLIRIRRHVDELTGSWNLLAQLTISSGPSLFQLLTLAFLAFVAFGDVYGLRGTIHEPQGLGLELLATFNAGGREELMCQDEIDLRVERRHELELSDL